MLTLTTLLDNAVSLIVFGALGSCNLRYAFGLDALVYIIVFGWVLLALRRQNTGV